MSRETEFERRIVATFASVAHLLGKKVNIADEAGEALGEHLARFSDAEIEKRRRVFPNHVERCATCAFRKGTLANGSSVTTMEALKCMMEGNEFMCHERTDYQCVGWAVLKSEKPVKVPWDFLTS